MFTIKKSQQVIPQSRVFYSHKKPQKSSTNGQPCTYCLKKQQLSNGDQTQRCLLHILRSKPQNQSPFSNSSRSHQSNIIQELYQLLADVQDVLEEYWQNLHEYSHGNQEKVKKQMEPVFQAMERIQEQLARFPFGKSNNASRYEIKRPHQLEQSRKQTQSERIIPTNYSQLFEDSTVNDQIKQWVIYFQKILIHRQVRQQLLPFDDELDMKIFKQSMQRKFVSFAKNYTKYQGKLSMALQKLLFYMQACGNNVGQKQLQEDIKFMESSQVPKMKGNDQKQYQMLMLQAVTIEDLLAKTQID